MWQTNFNDHDKSVITIISLTIFLQVGRLPPILYIQMDNCYRECKNKYVLAFLSILVNMGFFKKVHINSYTAINVRASHKLSH